MSPKAAGATRGGALLKQTQQRRTVRERERGREGREREGGRELPSFCYSNFFSLFSYIEKRASGIVHTKRRGHGANHGASRVGEGGPPD